MKNILKVITVVLLIMIEFGMIIFLYNKGLEKEDVVHSLELSNNNDAYNVIAILIEQEDGTYKESQDKKWPTDGYTFDAEKSGCLDKDGNKLEGILAYDLSTNIATVKTTETSYCYLYFNLFTSMSALDLIASKPRNLSESVLGGLYRFQGLATNVDNNYMCFGASDTTTCLRNPEYYLYRIIGITASGQFKLIKKEALDSSYVWNLVFTENIAWPASEISKAINGDKFLKNTTYVPNTLWSNKIADTVWKYGAIDNYDKTNDEADEIYKIENGFTNSVTAKVGLMYMHDYYYQSTINNCHHDNGIYQLCRAGWLHIVNNDDEAPYYDEWIMSRSIYANGYYGWIINAGGDLSYSDVTNTLAVRPIFYLKDNVLIIKGNGSATNPYIIS